MTKAVFFCSLISGIVVSLGLAITSFVIADRDQDHPCMGHDATGLNLSEWLNGFGASFVILVGMLAIGAILLLIGVKVIQAIVYSFVLFVFFYLAWFVIGIVILARGDRDCVASGEDLAILTIIDMILGWFSLAFFTVSAFILQGE